MSVLGPDSPLFKNEPSKRGQWISHHPYFVPTPDPSMTKVNS